MTQDKLLLKWLSLILLLLLGYFPYTFSSQVWWFPNFLSYPASGRDTTSTQKKKVNVTGTVQAFSALKATGTNMYKYITSTSHTWGHTRNMAEKEDSVRQGLHYGMMIEWVNLRQFQTACQRKASFFHFLVQYRISGSSFPPDLIIMKF